MFKHITVIFLVKHNQNTEPPNTKHTHICIDRIWGDGLRFGLDGSHVTGLSVPNPCAAWMISCIPDESSRAVLEYHVETHSFGCRIRGETIQVEVEVPLLKVSKGALTTMKEIQGNMYAVLKRGLLPLVLHITMYCLYFFCPLFFLMRTGEPWELLKASRWPLAFQQLQQHSIWYTYEHLWTMNLWRYNISYSHGLMDCWFELYPTIKTMRPGEKFKPTTKKRKADDFTMDLDSSVAGPRCPDFTPATAQQCRKSRGAVALLAKHAGAGLRDGMATQSPLTLKTPKEASHLVKWCGSRTHQCEPCTVCLLVSNSTYQCEATICTSHPGWGAGMVIPMIPRFHLFVYQMNCLQGVS